jgi:hypothetical protein
MKNSRLGFAGAATLSLAGMLFLHGAVPFLAMPTLGQAVWSTGFAQSFANESVLTIHAANFGVPRPAAIAFGLAGAWPAGLFIAAGLHPADAYSAMAALWLSLAFFCAYALARLVGVGATLSLGGAALWLSAPIIWAHAGYSMLGLGIALLPYYFLCALLLLLREPRPVYAALHILACVVAAFMDGYTFVMFVAGAALIGAWLHAHSPPRRRTLLRWALPVHLAGVLIAYVLYVSYVGTFHYERVPLEAFRAWGLDLAFFALPTEGVHWLPDALGWSSARSEERFFGDASVWRTTFALPLVLAALWAWWRTRRNSALATGLLLALVAGFYLALGPSLKVHAVRAAGGATGKAMAAHEATVPTGSAWVSAHVPGMRDMRAPYRWLALAVFSAWLLVMSWLACGGRAPLIVAAAIGVLNLPHIPQKWNEDAHYRTMFLQIDAELLQDLRRFLARGERVAFLPYGNDMLAGYLAARLHLSAYNIGGDKNLAEARRQWPETLRQMSMGTIEAGFAAQALLLLARGEADGVVLPYVDLLWAAHRWPTSAEYRESLGPVIRAMRESNLAEVVEREHFALVRLNASARAAGAAAAEAAVLRALCAVPICLRHGPFASPSAPSPVAAGRFRVRLHGAGVAHGFGHMELVSGQGRIRHASIRLLAVPADAQNGLLAEMNMTLHSRVEDLQIRIVQGEGDMLRLDGYEVLPRPGTAAKVP